MYRRVFLSVCFMSIFECIWCVSLVSWWCVLVCVLVSALFFVLNISAHIHKMHQGQCDPLPGDCGTPRPYLPQIKCRMFSLILLQMASFGAFSESSECQASLKQRSAKISDPPSHLKDLQPLASPSETLLMVIKRANSIAFTLKKPSWVDQQIHCSDISAAVYQLEMKQLYAQCNYAESECKTEPLVLTRVTSQGPVLLVWGQFHE